MSKSSHRRAAQSVLKVDNRSPTVPSVLFRKNFVIHAGRSEE
ncbi:hypothetical protein Rcae01_00001 [Novipirellula caenicola]|uniref:Uncharacterized protein n=1 Tax=Novipirellula caenicola TaxID=1536901 RepID=A0ABP9VLK1_9BACT